MGERYTRYDILNRRSNEPEPHRAITETKTARPSRTLKLEDKEGE